jgi:hypothetical protein
MPKVISGQGLQDFIQTGKPTENISREQPKAVHANPNHRPEEKPLEDTPPPPPPQTNEAPDRDIEQDDDWNKYADLPMPERIKKVVGKKHFEMMSAKEEAQELERLAEQQYNRAMLAEKRVRELEGQAPQAAPEPPKPEAKAPDQNDAKYRNDKGEFDWVQYTKDTADYSAAEAVSKFQKQQEQENNERQAAQAKLAYEARIEEARQVLPDYDQVVPGADIHTHQAVLNYVFFDSKVPGQIAYHLAKNPDFLRTLNSMSATAAVAEIGALAKTFEKPASKAEPAPIPKRSGGAPPPITPLDTSSSGTVNVDPSKMSFQELRRYHRAAKRR